MENTLENKAIEKEKKKPGPKGPIYPGGCNKSTTGNDGEDLAC